MALLSHGMLRSGAWAVLATLFAGTSCSPRPDTGPVVVSAIGGAPRLADPAAVALDAASRALTDATAQGLVRFDNVAQIETGLAERWTVIDGGTSFIFRLRDASWTDGSPVTAEQVVSHLKRQIASGSRNPLAPFLSAIDEIVVMTPQVIEIRLSRPRPDLLKLFAQPELGIIRRQKADGSGPFRVAGVDDAPLLRPAVDPAKIDPDAPQTSRPEDDVRLIGERASRAILRFADHRSDLVAGGTFDDWPLLQFVRLDSSNIRLDPAVGLFGLAIVNREGFLATAANRAALNGAIDRAAVVGAVRGEWEAADRILPASIDSAAPPVDPAWSSLTFDQRRAGARERVAAFGAPVTLRIAMPGGPGASLAYAQIARSLLIIGIRPERVSLSADADLRLVDAVAPYDSARWYLATACAECGDAAKAALTAARDAPTLAERSRLIAAADVALSDDVAFIPIARPLRWSLVANRLREWRPNARAWHPLNRLRDDTN